MKILFYCQTKKIISFQFSLALSKSGLVWTWGKGDYFRLGHGSDQHIRKPTVVECLRGKKIIHVAVGALHCLAVTETGQVYAWGDNDHGQQVHTLGSHHLFSLSSCRCLSLRCFVHQANICVCTLLQGNGTTTVNRKPALVHGLEGHRISRVSCGSSHSVCWTTPDTPSTSCHEPVLFAESKDPLGAGFVVNNNTNSRSGIFSQICHVCWFVLRPVQL